jgi:hypothetical protein
MTDVRLDTDFNTEGDGRGDLAEVDGDEQLGQQLATVSGNEMRRRFSAGTVTPERLREFTTNLQRKLRRIDDVESTPSVDIDGINHEDRTLTIDIRTELVERSETFTL